MRDDYPVTQAPNPHISRGRELVRAHPEVKQYLGPYPPSGLWIAGVVLFQLAVAYLLRGSGWLWVVLSAYLLGAFASHALFVLIHEAGHNLIAKTSTPNRLYGILCNVGQGIPTAISFRIFHGLHHSHLDEYDYDGDLAFRWEARVVGRSPLRKAAWLLLFPFIEIIRPMRIKKVFLDRWTALNFIAIAASDALVFWWCGLAGLAYLVLSTLFGVGLHVVGARWVQEHYTFVEGQETYSYYGPLNAIAFNIGYHNEHHDLVRVPWVHLPKIRALAPEFYDHLYAHRSWTRVLYWFVFDANVDLFTRITREGPAERDLSAA
jgi:sphingolipid delta-4 desaturase